MAATRVRTEFIYRGKHNHAYWREPGGEWQILPRVRPIAGGREDFDHGDPTPGARLLAASILAHAVGKTVAWELYLYFAVDVVARWPKDRMWLIQQGTVRAWVQAARMARAVGEEKQ